MGAQPSGDGGVVEVRGERDVGLREQRHDLGEELG